MILNARFDLDKISLAFIKHPFDSVQKEIGILVADTLTKQWKKKQYLLTENTKLAGYILEPDSEVVKILIWQPKSCKSDLVVFLTNMSDGWPTFLNYYFDRYKREIIHVKLSDDSKKFPIYTFEIMSLNRKRSVQVMMDSDKWKFFESGNIQPFEASENYNRKKIPERLNNTIIYSYLLKNGIDITDDEFWLSQGNAVEFSTRLGK